MSVQERVHGLMTVPEAAEMLGRNRSTVRTAVERGSIPGARIGRDDVRGGITVVLEADVRAYASRNGIRVTQQT